MIVSELIYAAFRIAGILGAPGRGYANDTSAAADGLQTLNALLDAMKTERLYVWAEIRTLFNTISNQADYTIGPSGADWTITRPQAIEQAGWVFTNTTPNTEVPLEIINLQQWQAISQKSITSTMATKLYYETSVANGIVHLWPKPLGSWKVALYTWVQAAEFAAATDTVTLPPGYRKMIEYNLAIELANRFPERQHISPDSVRIARETKARVKNANSPYLIARVDSGAMGTRDVSREGGYRIRSNSYS